VIRWVLDGDFDVDVRYQDVDGMQDTITKAFVHHRDGVYRVRQVSLRRRDEDDPFRRVRARRRLIAGVSST
jgi:hypothetical protein